MKVEKRDGCWGCALRFASSKSTFSPEKGLEREFTCLKDHHRAADWDALFSACPLPDWPSVSMKQIKDGLNYIFCGGTSGRVFVDKDMYQPIINAAVKQLRSIGVEVREDNK